MTDTALRLKDELSKLPSHDRAALAHYLLDTLDDEVDADAEAAWDAELRRREEQVLSGTVRGRPASEVMAELREKHK